MINIIEIFFCIKLFSLRFVGFVIFSSSWKGIFKIGIIDAWTNPWSQEQCLK